MSDLGYGLGGGTLGSAGLDGLGNGGPSWSIGQGQAQSYFNQALNIALTQVVGVNPNNLSAGQRAQLQDIINGSPYLVSLMSSSQMQQSLTAGSSGYQIGEDIVTYIAQAIEGTLFPNLSGASTIGNVADPSAASAGLQWKASVTKTPQTTQSLYQEELLSMGLPADMYTTYAGVVSTWEKYFASEPTPQQLVQLLGIQLPSQGQPTSQLSVQQEQQIAGRQALGQPGQPAPSGGQQGVNLQQTGPGGTLNYAQLEGLWIAAGGDPSVANIAAAIAFPESSANPSEVQQGQPYAYTGWGLWQITPGNSFPSLGTDNALLNPMTNARAAVQKWKDAGNSFTPWTTYTGGQYLQYLKNNVQPDNSAAVHFANASNVAAPNQGGASGSAYGIALPNPASISQAGITDEIRQMPSNIPGLNMGQYSDLQGSANSVLQPLLGHSASDGLLASLAQGGYNSPGEIENYLSGLSGGALQSMGSEVYNNIYSSNQSTLQNVYNENGFDPSLAIQQYQQYYQKYPGENPVGPQAGEPAPSESSRQKASQSGRRPSAGAY